VRKAVITGIIWTLINIGAIEVVKHGDSSNWNEILLFAIAIPVGLINAAVLFNSFYRVHKFNWQQVVYSLFGLVNAAYFLIAWNNLDLASGSMTN